MNKRQQKLFVMLVIAFVVFVFIGLFLFKERAQTQSKTAPEFETAAGQLFTVSEIGKTFSKPTTLGTMTYKIENENTIHLYSSAYEDLNPKCRGRHIAELFLSDTQNKGDDIPIEGTYQFAQLTLHPMGSCDDNSAQEQAFYKAVSDMLQNPS